MSIHLPRPTQDPDAVDLKDPKLVIVPCWLTHEPNLPGEVNKAGVGRRIVAIGHEVVESQERFLVLYRIHGHCRTLSGVADDFRMTLTEHDHTNGSIQDEFARQ